MPPFFDDLDEPDDGKPIPVITTAPPRAGALVMASAGALDLPAMPHGDPDARGGADMSAVRTERRDLTVVEAQSTKVMGSFLP